MRERQTHRYQSALQELDRCAALQSLDGPGSFYQWERLSLLTERLRGLFDAFELEGDLGPLAEAVEVYQADLAQRLGVSRQTVNAIETEKYDPSLPLAFRIAALFGLAIEAIFTSE